MAGFPKLMAEESLMDKRLIELAIEALEQRKASIDAEIAAIRAELTGRGRVASISLTKAAVAPKKRGPRSKAARKAQSERMRAYWAKKRAESKSAPKSDGDAKKRK